MRGHTILKKQTPRSARTLRSGLRVASGRVHFTGLKILAECHAIM